MYRKLSVLFGICLLLVLTACAAEMQPVESDAPPSEPQAAVSEELADPTPEPTLEVDLDIAGQLCSLDARALSLSAPDAEDLVLLCRSADRFTDLETLSLTDCVLTPEQVFALREAFPEVELQYTVSVFDKDRAWNLRQIYLGDRQPSELDSDALAKLLLVLPELQVLKLIDQEPDPRWTLDELLALRSVLPQEVALGCRFTLFGQIVDSDMKQIVYEKAGLHADDLDTVRAALPLLTGCRRFVLDNCGPSYEELAKLRDEFPDKGIVWRVHFMGDSLLTDEKVLWSTFVRDENCHVLKYCNELEYVDLGHDETLSDISFTAYMPKLKVLIVARTVVEDISALANCPELEYLELFGTKVKDLSPLANCTKLEHLNISTLFYLRDISPLYNLTSLKRLRMVHSGGVPVSQMEEITRLLPDCRMMFNGSDPTGSGWRRESDGEFAERYALLREQIGYNGYNAPEDKIDWDKAWRPGYA